MGWGIRSNAELGNVLYLKSTVKSVASYRRCMINGPCFLVGGQRQACTKLIMKSACTLSYIKGRKDGTVLGRAASIRCTVALDVSAD